MTCVQSFPNFQMPMSISAEAGKNLFIYANSLYEKKELDFAIESAKDGLNILLNFTHHKKMNEYVLITRMMNQLACWTFENIFKINTFGLSYSQTDDNQIYNAIVESAEYAKQCTLYILSIPNLSSKCNVEWKNSISLLKSITKLISQKCYLEHEKIKKIENDKMQIENDIFSKKSNEKIESHKKIAFQLSNLNHSIKKFVQCHERLNLQK